MGDQPLEKAGIHVIVGKVASLDTRARNITLESGEVVSYERLVLATGTTAAMPSIPGVDKEGVLTIHKSMAAMTTLRKKIHEAKKVVIIGGGFIGAEFADELSKIEGLEIHLIEIAPKILFTAFDDEFCDKIEEVLIDEGVKLHTNSRVAAINGNHRVESVTIEGGGTLPADLVLFGTGAKPSVELAQTAGLRITDKGSIWVDDYMQTDTQGVFAVGDCALKQDFFTRREVPVWLASTATSEARNAGVNLYGISFGRYTASNQTIKN